MNPNFIFKPKYKHLKHIFANLLSFITSIHESFLSPHISCISLLTTAGAQIFYENLGTRCKNGDKKGPVLKIHKV